MGLRTILNAAKAQTSQGYKGITVRSTQNVVQSFKRLITIDLVGDDALEVVVDVCACSPLEVGAAEGMYTGMLALWLMRLLERGLVVVTLPKTTVCPALLVLIATSVTIDPEPRVSVVLVANVFPSTTTSPCTRDTEDSSYAVDSALVAFEIAR